MHREAVPRRAPPVLLKRNFPPHWRYNYEDGDEEEEDNNYDDDEDDVEEGGGGKVQG